MLNNIKFATDLVTFYAPEYWGGSGDMSDLEAVLAANGWDALRFWERMLTDVNAAGLDGIEITFAPGNWQSAIGLWLCARLRRRIGQPQTRIM